MNIQDLIFFMVVVDALIVIAGSFGWYFGNKNLGWCLIFEVMIMILSLLFVPLLFK